MNKFTFTDKFERRHIGPSEVEIHQMLHQLGCSSLDELIDQTVPSQIRTNNLTEIPPAMGEAEYLRHLKQLAVTNRTFRSYIGRGYHGTITPSVILRNLFENPGWYTQYTPYQAEIAQGRLESLLNFQTMIGDLTGLPIANASLLDEATAAAEAMQMFYSERNKRSSENDLANEFFVDEGVLPQTIDVLRSRAEGHHIRIVVGDWKKYKFKSSTFGVLLQYPNCSGEIEEYQAFVQQAKQKQAFTCVAADIMSLVLLTPPGEWGADVVVGNSQRFGVPMGYGGPHAAFFATTEDFKRQIPGRIIGVSVDKHGHKALRMALQTREQHIRREKATSNICTAQALLANMAAMYAVYHGKEGLKAIAQRINSMASCLRFNLSKAGYAVVHEKLFDTVKVAMPAYKLSNLMEVAQDKHINFYFDGYHVQISIDETVSHQDFLDILLCFNISTPDLEYIKPTIPKSCNRTSDFLTHPVFNTYHTESAMMRYLKHLENKDLSLAHSMISLGSCTMKLNAATQMIPVTWDEFSNVHPFAPIRQVRGYHQMISQLSAYLSDVTGFPGCSLQPNSGAQGEYAGLMVIRAFHLTNKQPQRNVALIPSSAHGTNPASAIMAGMKVVVVNCDDNGNIDIDDLRMHAKNHRNDLSCLMVTYPSTHGVFEEGIIGICQIIHQYGGKVYMDGANMNAQVGLTSPAAIGADVCHLNLHKTFAIPHGGGGPGMGPICCTKELAPYLPGHTQLKNRIPTNVNAVSAAPFGSANILLISYAYIRLLGAEGLKKSTQVAILNANYIKHRLESAYTPLYTGKNGRVAHELILDLRPFKALVSAEDVAKRLIDYGFHAPTLSFPVAGTIMIEPTESENQDELDRFCDALLQIRAEIDEIAEGKYDKDNNVLHNAPHTLAELCAEEWKYPYSRQKAAFPLPYLHTQGKFWATVGRIDQAFGDRNLVCTCPPIESYQTSEA